MTARMVLRIALGMALPFCMAMSNAFAQTAPPSTAASAPAVDVRAACKADMEKLCPNVERGDARRACVEANKDKFSDSCKAARNAARDANHDQRQAFRAACANDIAKLCANIERGQGRTVDCMRTNVEKLTPSCKAELTKLSANSFGTGSASQRQ